MAVGRDPDPTDLLTASATRIASWIRAGDVSPREVVEIHIARIRRLNPRLNAVVAERFEQARREADAAGELVGRRPPEALPPLLGVPCTIKEAYALAGMPHTAGLVARRRHRASRDATAVARLRAAGAIPLGVTNVPELCMWMETSNRVYGRTNNAYHPGRTAGGSSGGEGAIVGAGGVPFGLGSDIGGSIRLPAFFNGVFGHKSTGGLVPGTGQWPLPANEARRYNTTGPLARRAEDLMPLLRLVAGPDGEDTACTTLPLGQPAAVSIDGLRVLDVRGDGLHPVEESLLQAQERAAAALAARGAIVAPASVAGLRRSLVIWASKLSAAGGPSFRELLSNGRRFNAALELLRWSTRRSDHTLPSIALAAIERLPDLAPRAKGRALAASDALRAEILDLIGPTGVMLYPTYPRVAPRHHAPMLRPLSWVYTSVFNALELPVTQVPLGLDARGLPLGVQVVSAPGNDHVTIAVALALEESLGGWVPPAWAA